MLVRLRSTCYPTLRDSDLFLMPQARGSPNAARQFRSRYTVGVRYSVAYGFPSASGILLCLGPSDMIWAVNGYAGSSSRSIYVGLQRLETATVVAAVKKPNPRPLRRIFRVQDGCRSLELFCGLAANVPQLSKPQLSTFLSCLFLPVSTPRFGQGDRNLGVLSLRPAPVW
jgi:hypothetical protein